MSRHFRDSVADYFRHCPYQWVSAYDLIPIGGSMAWRTRISECRTQLGMTIENKVERDRSGKATSYYRYVPASEPRQANLLERAS